MDPTERLRIVASVDDADSPSDVVDLLGLAAFVSGEQPWARSVRLARVRRDAALLPDGVEALRTVVASRTSGDGHDQPAAHPGPRVRSWCDLDFVLDPERLLAEPGYLMRVALEGDVERRPRWRLLVLEDCDELIRVEAKQGAGQSLARLLNLTDGVVGQGLNVLVCITTNEDLSSLHPAVTRPGRCVAQLHVGRLTRDEATSWAGSPAGIESSGATLAELFARRDHGPTIESRRTEERIGLYL